MLTELDECRKLDNLLILATSNFAASLDSAFLSRVDLNVPIGSLNEKAIYWILQGMLEELERAGILLHVECEKRTWELCTRMMLSGINGRALRRLPFQVLSCFAMASSSSITRAEFIETALHLIDSAQICAKGVAKSPESYAVAS